MPAQTRIRIMADLPDSQRQRLTVTATKNETRAALQKSFTVHDSCEPGIDLDVYRKRGGRRRNADP